MLKNCFKKQDVVNWDNINIQYCFITTKFGHDSNNNNNK
jgi:hypothetical protein